MNEEDQAQALGQYLDNHLPGKDPTGPADAEFVALGELGRSLSGVQFQPRPTHQAAIDRLLEKHRPALRSGGSGTTTVGPGGTPFYGILMLIALIVGAFTLIGAGTFIDLPHREEPSPALPTNPIYPPQEFVPDATTLAPPTPALSLTVARALTTIPPAATRLPILKVISSATPTVTATPSTTATPAATATLTATATPTVTATPTATVTPPATVTPTATITPTLPISNLERSRAELAFHPEHLNAGGACKVTYLASGSLKNHGPGTATGVEITHKVVDGALWVDHVTVTPDSWDELGTSKPARFTIYVHTNEAWSSAGKDAVIVVRLHADRDAQTIFTIKSQCKPEPPEKSDKPNKPDKSDKSPKPKKRKKSFYDPGIDASRPGEARSILSQGEV